MSEHPVFLDFEASSLGDNSYPIEVAWSRPDGSIRPFLIDPTDIAAWTDWSMRAQEVHGITRAELRTAGLPPREVDAQLKDDLGGGLIYTDAPEWDAMWLERLFKAGSSLRPHIDVGDANLVFQQELTQILALARTNRSIDLTPIDLDGAETGDPEAMAVEAIRKLLGSLHAQSATRHRAAADVAVLVRAWSMLRDLRERTLRAIG